MRQTAKTVDTLVIGFQGLTSYFRTNLICVLPGLGFQGTVSLFTQTEVETSIRNQWPFSCISNKCLSSRNQQTASGANTQYRLSRLMGVFLGGRQRYLKWNENSVLQNFLRCLLIYFFLETQSSLIHLVESFRWTLTTFPLCKNLSPWE